MIENLGIDCYANLKMANEHKFRFFNQQKLMKVVPFDARQNGKFIHKIEIYECN